MRAVGRGGGRGIEEDQEGEREVRAMEPDILRTEIPVFMHDCGFFFPLIFNSLLLDN